MPKIILDLCAGTGAWSQPYADAGYEVRRVTMPEDLRLVTHPGPVHGILAAPPCTDFARCGARWWARKGEQALLNGLSVVDACLRMVTICQPQWWVLENPVGRLRHYIGEPSFMFDPWEYGDPWTKRTWLWGVFNLPKKMDGAVKPMLSVPGHKSSQHLRNVQLERAILDRVATRPDWIHRLGPSKNRAALRSITPPGFARAFFEANP